MQKKIKMRKMMIFMLAIIIAFLIVSLVSGEKDLEKVVIIKEKIDLTKTLEEQVERLEVIQVTKTESQKFGDSVVRNLASDIKDKRLIHDLPPGTPIPKVLLSEGDTFGEFASATPKNRTLYKLGGGIGQLPPGVAEGDKIDIGLKVDKKIGLLYRDVKIGRLTEADIYLDVSQKDYYRLLLAEEMGDFVLQLPGSKDVPLCSTLSKEEREVVECYNKNDAPRPVDSSEIQEIIDSGEPFGEEEDSSNDLEGDFSLENENTAEGTINDLLKYYESGTETTSDSDNSNENDSNTETNNDGNSEEGTSNNNNEEEEFDFMIGG